MSIVRVARLARVSRSTVSNVINGTGRFAEETERAVRRAMAKLGYTPRPRNRRPGPKPGAKAGLRTRNVVLATFGISRAVLRAPVYMDLLHGVEEALRESAIDLTLCHAGIEWPPVESLARKADGFILFGGGEPHSVARALRRLPCVSTMSTGARRSWGDWVSYDNDAVGPLAADHLLQRGHRCCAYLGAGGDPYRARRRGFAERLGRSGADVRSLVDDRLVVDGGDVHSVDRARLARLLGGLCSLSPRPTGLFIAADMLTAAAYPILIDSGVRPGRDIEIVSCNNEWPLRVGLSPRPAVIDIQARLVGRRAVEQLIWRAAHRDETRTKVLLDPKLVIEGVDGPPPGKRG